MKRNLFNLLLFIAILTSLIYSCKNADVSPEGSIEGRYKEINNPVLCSRPTMSDIVIKAKGTGYSISFLNLNTSANETLSDFNVEKTDSTSKVFYKGAEVGTFGSMRYTEFSGSNFETKEGIVLMLNFGRENMHYEFMGRK